MSKIDEFWKDITVYYVEFTRGKEDTIVTHCKVLVLKNGLREEEVIELVKIYFNNIIEVTCVDELYDGLILKEEFHRCVGT